MGGPRRWPFTGRPAGEPPAGHRRGQRRDTNTTQVEVKAAVHCDGIPSGVRPECRRTLAASGPDAVRMRSGCGELINVSYHLLPNKILQVTSSEYSCHSKEIIFTYFMMIEFQFFVQFTMFDSDTAPNHVCSGRSGCVFRRKVQRVGHHSSVSVATASETHAES